jgi:hypothetical protein
MQTSTQADWRTRERETREKHGPVVVYQCPKDGTCTRMGCLICGGPTQLVEHVHANNSPASSAQRTLIQRLRRILSVIPSQHPVKGWLSEGHLMPSTNREAERLIDNLYRQINKRLAKLPEDQRNRFRVPCRVA